MRKPLHYLHFGELGFQNRLCWERRIFEMTEGGNCYMLYIEWHRWLGLRKKETDIKKWRRSQSRAVILWNTVKRKEKRERERKVRKTGRQRQTQETRVKRDREDEKDHSPIWTLKISSFLFCSPSMVLESRKEDGGYAVYTSASLPFFTPQPHQKASNSLSSSPNKKLTHISSFSIII